jgi:hypothetical protein
MDINSESSGNVAEISDKSKEEVIELIKNDSQEISREIATEKIL